MNQPLMRPDLSFAAQQQQQQQHHHPHASHPLDHEQHHSMGPDSLHERSRRHLANLVNRGHVSVCSRTPRLFSLCRLSPVILSLTYES